jgi:hypothetical protein
VLGQQEQKQLEPQQQQQAVVRQGLHCLHTARTSRPWPAACWWCMQLQAHEACTIAASILSAAAATCPSTEW